jgi:putative peptidoglycan lipid II flippase
MSESSSPPPRPRDGSASISSHSSLVALGIVLSRLAGYVRGTLIAAMFGGKSDAAEAFYAALKIPNFLQNLFGDGALSASLIPVYVGLRRRGQEAEADQMARTVLGVLGVVVAVLVLIGVTCTPYLMPVIAPGWAGTKRELTIELVRIMFPGVGLLVASAWCLAILNSHRRFLLAYASPVLWNAAMIATLAFNRGHDLPHIARNLAWAAVVGSALQLGVQAPTVWGLMAGSWTSLGVGLTLHVRQVLVSAVPVVLTRGVVQVSAFIDGMIATLLPTGAVTGLANAQQIYTFPISLFGMAISAAELPAMAEAAQHTDRAELIRARLEVSQRTVIALVVPSALALLVFGDVIVSMLYEHGKFTHGDSMYGWAILAGSSVGLLSTTLGRLWASAFFALGDTSTPTKAAMVRVAIVTVLGYLCAVYAPGLLGLELRWGAAGLTLSAGLAGWMEFALLRRGLNQRIGTVPLQAQFLLKAWLAALVAAGVATGLRFLIPVDLALIRGVAITLGYGSLYLAIAHVSGLIGFDEVIGRFRKRAAVGGKTRE